MRQLALVLVMLVAGVSSAAAAVPRPRVAYRAVEGAVPPAEQWYYNHNSSYAGMNQAGLAKAMWGLFPRHIRLTVFNSGQSYCLEDIADGPAYHYVGGYTPATVKLASMGRILPGHCPAGTGTPR